MGIGLFPPKRRVITEKFDSDKTSKKGLFRAEFMDFKYAETFIVDCVSSIVSTVTWAGPPNLPPLLGNPLVRTEWSPVSLRILECEGPGNGERLSAWINTHLFSEYYSNAKACSIKLVRLCDRDDMGVESWMLYGCIPKSITEEQGSVFIEFHINHGVLNPQNRP